MTKKLVILFVATVLFSCSKTKEKQLTLYVGNYGTDNFDTAVYRIKLNEGLIFDDTVVNEYVSFHWTEKNLKVSENKLSIWVEIEVEEQTIIKDTMVSVLDLDSIGLFVKFEFNPYFKRYTNPEIYRLLEGGEIDNFRLKEFADSLYKADILPNADEFLNDTIPSPSTIRINIK